jgi:predicted tellurium resistance membrane protein TerC
MVELAIAFVALTVMEIVLGIDNIVFISIQTSKLPKEQRPRARWFGLAAAMGTRILLLLAINWVMQLTQPIFEVSSLGIGTGWLRAEHHEEINRVTWKDLVLLAGGLFLLNSSVREIHHKMEGHTEENADAGTGVSMVSVIVQIGVLDIIFSLDSVITAIGMVNSGDEAPQGGIYVMIAAVIAAVIVMMFFSGPVSRFVEKHPTVKMLALSFLLLIAVMLVADALGTHIEKGYIYFAMGFALMVEMFNLRASAARKRKQQQEYAAIAAGKEG